MKGSTISRDSRRRLAEYIAGAKREIVSFVVDSQAANPLGERTLSDSAGAFVDRLARELAGVEQGDVRAELWAKARDEDARVAGTVCTFIAASYVPDRGEPDDALAYLAERARELERRTRIDPRQAVTFEPAKLARDEVVSSLLSAMEARDGATCDHSRAVGAWCGRIAKTVGLDAEAQAFAALAGTLHDVGKVATPTEILLKQGPLDDDEWETMRAHARIGAKMLERIPSLREFAPVVRAHHERVDGRGYPDHIAGDAIPLPARIIAVADSFHAMISKRPYRQAMPVSKALAELHRGAGTQYDSNIVAAMLGMVQPAAHALPRMRSAR